MSTKSVLKLNKEVREKITEQKAKVEALQKKDIDKAIKEWKAQMSSFQCWTCDHCSFMREYDEIRVVNLTNPKNDKPCFALCLLGSDTMKMRRGKDMECYGFIFFKR